MDEIRKLTHRDVILALIKHQNIHEGVWQLYVEFGITAGNLPVSEENQDNLRLCPTAIIPIKTIGLMKVDKEGPLALDASKVNPPV
jgi:hypothetical protein